MSDRVLIVDADEAERNRIAAVLQGSAPNIQAFASAEEAIGQLHSSWSGCALVAADLPGSGARALIAEIMGRKLPLAVVVIDHNSDLKKAVELVRAGAFDVLEQPLTARRLRWMVRRTLSRGA